jgi:putative ABC transport system permease protein
MIRNFFTVALRTFLRQKFYSLLNVLGLATGLISALFIFLWVKDEVNHDKFHRDGESIFRIVSNLRMQNGEVITWDITPGPLADDIRDNIPEVSLAVRTMQTGPELFQYQDKSFSERGLYADADFFRLFSFEVISGKPSIDSGDVSHVSISRRLAEKLFGNDEPIGKTIKVNLSNDYTIASVFEDVPNESSIQFDYILPLEVFRKRRGEGFNWGNYDHPLYVRLGNPDLASQAMEKINQRRKMLAEGDDRSNVEFFMQPFQDAYLYGHFENGRPVGGRIEYVKLFSLVAVFILVIACINFMNMATAKAANRSKEVGIRKVVGAQRKSLIFQFIGESVFISCVAMLVAIGVVYTALPLFNILVGKQITVGFTDATFLFGVMGIVLLTGFLAGSYPALFLSSYQPVRVLKGTAHGATGGGALRKTLVIFQFTLTVILIASALVIYDQIGFIMKKNLGYEKGSVITFSGPGSLLGSFESFKNEALQFPAIKHVSKANESLVQVYNQNSSLTWPGKPEDSEEFFRTVVVDYGFMETMGLKLEDGRYFSKQFNDTSNFIVTRRALEVMGLRDPIGQTISQWGFEGKIIGVVNDIHSRSMHEAIDPVVFLCKPEWTGRIFVRFEGQETRKAVDYLANLYKKYSPEYPFNYSFLEDDFERLYRNERITASLALGFTLMAIIISGLGLLGLAAYTSERRRKEISIRKTLGASVTGIVAMISGDFAKLTLIAIGIGCPIAWLAMEQFLSGYAYHTELQWQVFAITAISIVLISLITVAYQVIKAALANPVDALRNE